MNIGYEAPADRPYRSRYVCDADGDDCHWVRVYDYDRGYYDRSYEDDFGY